jgi:predicted nucleic acid-binding protein
VVTYALDSSAVLRFLENEAGARRIEALLQNQFSGKAVIVVSALHWGEVAGYAYKTHGRAAVNPVLQRLIAMGLEIIPVTADQAIAAAQIKLDYKIPYVDAFGAVIASDPNHVFVTADFDLKPAAQFAKIEFLSTK